MREIKFRGINNETGQFVYGYYLKSGSSFHGGEKHYIAIDGSVNNYAGLKFIEVIPETISQYTGLKDKNGKEIYEGDIISGDLYDYRLPTMGVIIFDNGIQCYCNKNEGGNTPIFKIDKIEKIGNIHENPELLEAVK